jgi:hypothetical protein
MPSLRIRVSTIAIAVLASSALGGFAATFAAAAPADPCSAAYPSFGVGNWPPACWRPYADTSPFNVPIPPNPRLNPRSAQIVQRLLEQGPPTAARAGISQSGGDFGKPLYWARTTDPLVTVHGSAPVEGDRIRVPSGARPADGGDAHMTIIQPDGWEYDFWRAQAPAGGALNVETGRKMRVDGDGFGNGVVAARFGNLAGRVRAQEMEGGLINHALEIAVVCTSGRYVWPSVTAGSKCSNTTDAPSLGDRFQLALSDAQIAAMPVPSWKKTILRALAHYGAYVGEQSSHWSLFGFESGATYTSFGIPDEVAVFAQRSGIRQSSDGVYYFRMDDIDWARYMRVVDSSVARTAPASTLGALLLRRLSVKPRRFRAARGGHSARRKRARRGAAIRYRLSAPASVTFAIARVAKGRKVRGHCRRPSRNNRRGRRCSRALSVGSFSAGGVRGLNRTPFSGRLGRKRLRSGAYRLTAVAVDATGVRSKPKRAGFRVLRSR